MGTIDNDHKTFGIAQGHLIMTRTNDIDYRTFDNAQSLSNVHNSCPVIIICPKKERTFDSVNGVGHLIMSGQYQMSPNRGPASPMDSGQMIMTG